jgi:hypothetical protein
MPFKDIREYLHIDMITYTIVLQLFLVHVDDAVTHTVQEVLRVGNYHQNTGITETVWTIKSNQINFIIQKEI